MLSEILQTANLYAAGLEHVREKRLQWIKKHDELKEHLKQVAAYLNENTTYKQGFFIDSLHAYNEDINGTCNEIPSLTFRSGDMPMLVGFHNSVGEKTEYMEEGFRITFNPMVTGDIMIMFLPHQSALNETPAEYSTLAVIKEPGEFTMDKADELIRMAIEAAFYSSFTGISEQPLPAGQHEETHHPLNRNPIGFKRYETTEKVK